MKIRNDFVTNSSSSSYVIVYKVDDNKKFREILEYKMGQIGLELADKYLIKGKNLQRFSDGKTEIHDYIEDESQFSDEDSYFFVTHYTYSDDPDDFFNEKLFLEEYMPKEFVTQLYETDC